RKPRLVHLIATRLGRARKMPAIVPLLDPAMIAAAIGRERRADKSSGNADRAACVDQQDGKTGARGQSRVDGFVVTLVGAIAARRVANVQDVEDLLVESHRRLAR